jgi:ferric-dicitrate binding protein FerR (iron transport regulator)
MNISPEQYERFLTNQCSEEERLLFINYLELYPEALEHLLHSTGWDVFEENLHLHPVYSSRMRDRFMTYIDQQKQKRTIGYRLAVAAAVLAIVSASLVWLLSAPKDRTVVAAQLPAEAAREAWEVVSNQSDSITTLWLKDHSSIKLYAHSRVRYKKEFTGARRDIYLEGTAHFAVAKDARRPFTVYAGGIATTALGTAFRVTTKHAHNKVQVILYEGKVVVRVADSTVHTKANPVYLLPGQELVMNTAGVYDLRKTIAGTQEHSSHKRNKPVAVEGLTFTNIPLEDVLQQLEQQFKTNILYKSEQIKTISITASFTDQDTLSDILNILCTLNNLQFKRIGSEYIISR